MRLHRLRLTAFGSFPGEEEVEFDALTSAGLFLVHGPTGAGKTTVLDAVCYALYGRVPGQRDSARSLRCDHAPSGRGPLVVLEVTLRGRRFRITRSPVWHRHKKKGEGLIEEKAKAIVEELAGGEWISRTTRADEAGHLLGELLGMSVDQFCQVAMLPQGDFARFLRAGGDERRELLKRLFTVKTFSDAEQWLADHRTRSGRDQQELRQQVDFVLKRIEEAYGSPSDGGPDVLADPLAWAGVLVTASDVALAEAASACTVSEAALRAALRRLEDGRALADRQRRHGEALARHAGLEETAEERSELETILDEAARADRVLPLLQGVAQRAEAAAKADQLASDAMARALPLVRPEGAGRWPGAERLDALERARRDEIARLGELRVEEERLTRLAAECERIERDLTEWAEREREIATRLDVLPGLRRENAEALEVARLAAARVPGAEAHHRAALELARAAERRDALERELSAAREALHLAMRPDGVPGGWVEPDDLEAVERGCLDEVARLESLGDDEARLRVIRDRLVGLGEEFLALTEREAAARAALAELPALLDEATALLGHARADAARVPAGESARESARARLDAARRRDVLAGDLGDAEERRRDAVDRAQELRDRLLEIRQARIEGMAAELAHQLVPGMPCAVCGSAEHPAPASPPEAGVGAADEQEAEALFEEADEARQRAEGDLAGLAVRLDEASSLAGEVSSEEAELAVDAAEAELAGYAAAAERADALEDRTETLRAELERVEERVHEIERGLTEHRMERDGLRAEEKRLAARVDTARGDDESVLARRDRLAGQARAIRAAIDAAERVREVAARHANARAAIGDDVTAGDAAEGVAEAERSLAELRELAGHEADRVAEAERIEAELTELAGESTRIGRSLTAGRTRRDELTADADRLTARLERARGGDPTLADRLDRLTDEAALLRDAAEAARVARTAMAERASAWAEAEAASEDAGFAGIDDARAAGRTAAEREAMMERLRSLDAEQAAVELLLRDPELLAASAETPPDLGELEASHQDAATAHESRVSARDGAAHRRDRLTELRADLEEAWARWLPAQVTHDLAKRMAELVGGTSGDNPLHIRLSSYVLGERLRQVVDAANERLDHMSGGRYLLLYDQRKSAGDRRKTGGGLGLRVLDGWTGVDRDPATLSGGESFVTSLALALGLADVVTDEAGGVEIGTLFVDEGFGTLDEDTLDGVLDILDGLRAGGRAVGIVSHVAELRTRILAQLQVEKGRHGSTLRVRA